MPKNKRIASFTMEVLSRLNDVINDVEDRYLAYVVSGFRASAFANPDWTLDRFWSARNRRARQALYALQRQKLIEVRRRGDRIRLALTETGEQRMLAHTIANAPKCERDDVVIIVFDVPESERRTRQQIRLFLSEHRFTQIQKSVWESAYDVAMPLTEFIRRIDAEQWVQVYRANRLTSQKTSCF